MGGRAGKPGPRDAWELRGITIQQRLAEISQRLNELRQARPQAAGQDTAMDLLWQAQRHAVDADRHLRETIAHTVLVRQLVVQAFHRAARAHEHAAEAAEHAVAAGIGDVAEYRRRAGFHRAAAEADHQRAKEIEAERPASEFPG